MAQKTDLYSILTAYATRYNSPYIEIEAFLLFVEKYAIQQAPERPEWQKWTRETSVKFWAELAPLVEQQRCEVLGEGRLYLTFWAIELINTAYRSIDDTAEMPFPDEKTLKINLPAENVRILNVDRDLFSYLENPQGSPLPAIRLVFPEDFGNALVTAAMIPQRLMEAALLKIRQYLRNHGGRDYALHKLPPQVTEREIHLRDILNQIQVRPLDCIKAIEASEDFANLFWACFCSLVKNDVRREKEREKEELAAIQAAFLLETFNSFFKAGVMRERERELAFKSLDSQFDRPPYVYTQDAIVRFTSSKGVLLLGQYSREELEAWLKKKTTESLNNELPEILILSGGLDRQFIKKKHIFPLFARQQAEARALVRKALERRWLRILTAYGKEPAMENDRNFEKLLLNYTAELCPAFFGLLNDPKLPVLQQEMEQTEAKPKEVSTLFIGGERIPLGELYSLKRKDLLANVRILLPFWYSIPVLVAIASFFAGIGKKDKKNTWKTARDEDEESGEKGEKNSGRELRLAGEVIEAAIVPEEYTINDYLRELEDRWSRVLDKDARMNLTEDVKVLIRDHLRYNLRNQKNVRYTQEVLGQMASNIISSNAGLKKLKEQKPLHTYIMVYLTQLLLSSR